MFVAEQKQQQEQRRALQMEVSMKQAATEQQLAVYEQQVEFMEQLLGKVKEGKVYGILTEYIEWGSGTKSVEHVVRLIHSVTVQQVWS